MLSEAVIEVVHLRLHASGSSSFLLARLATPDLPSSFLNTWQEICSSASKAGNHRFRLLRSAKDPADFFFIGGWDDAGVHAKIIGRSRDSQLAASLGKWMEHVSVRHIKADVGYLDETPAGTSKAAMREWTVKQDGQDAFDGSELWTNDGGTCTAGWDVSREVQSKYKEFEDMANVLDNGTEVFKLGRGRVDEAIKVWVALRFGTEHSMLLHDSDGGGSMHLLNLVLEGSPYQSNDLRLHETDEEGLRLS